MKLKNLCVATAAAAGIAASSQAGAISFGIDFKGFVTMVQGNDVPAFAGRLLNNGSTGSDVPPFFGFRTEVTGNMVLNIGLTGLSGTATIDDIIFFNTVSKGRNITFKPVSTLLGIIPTNTLLLGNMSFDFGTLNGIPVSIVLDLGNLTTALMAGSLGDIVGGIMIAPTENTIVTLADGSMKTLPMGPVVVATTTWNTTDVDTDMNGTPGPVLLNSNPSGTTPLIKDTVVDGTNGDIGLGGSPIRSNSLFKGVSPNFDFKQITVKCINLLGTCPGKGSISLPPLTLNPDPLAPLLGGLSKLLKGLGL